MVPQPARTIYLTRAKYATFEQELNYMEHDGVMRLSELLAASPGSGMGRPLDLPVHDLARRFYAEMAELRGKLNRAEIIENHVQNLSNHGVVDIGARVTITDLNANERLAYTILGPDEVEPESGRISYLSPLGAAVMGKRSGDVVSVLSAGAKFRIDQIEYLPLDFTYQPTDWRHQFDMISK